MIPVCPTAFLASAQPLVGSEGGFSWWQVIGGMVAVFALLLICLKLLGRIHGGSKRSEAAVIAVWPLGPKREIQIIRLHDEVHYVYRHESGLVVLERMSYAEYKATHPDSATGVGGSMTSITSKVGNWLNPRDLHSRIVASGRLNADDSPTT